MLQKNKKLIVILAIGLTVLITVGLFAIQTAPMPPEIEWSKTYGGLNGYSLIQTSDGGYLLVGSNATYSSLDRGYIGYNTSVIKTDKLGNIIWHKSYSFSDPWSSPSPLYVTQTKDGGYALAGRNTTIERYPEYRILNQFFLAALDSKGNLVWSKTFGNNQNSDTVHDLIETDDGGYAMVGTTQPSGYSQTDIFLVKTDDVGNVMWNATYQSNDWSQGWSVIQTSGTGYSIIGTKGTSYLLIKTDPQGNMEWNQTYTGKMQGQTCASYARSGILTIDGGYLLVGYLSWSDEQGKSVSTAWVVKTDSNGNIQWDRTYGDLDKELISSAVQTLDGGYVYSGRSDNVLWVVETDSFGNLKWALKNQQGTVEPLGKSITRTIDGGYALIGTSPTEGILLTKIASS